MKFATMFGERKRFFNEPGSRIKPDRVLQYDKQGRMYLKQVGEKNIYDQIQSYADQVNVNYIVERYMNGDNSVLMQRAGYYFDASNMPENVAEVYRLVNNGHYLFDSLPVDIKSKFNNSFSEFIASIGSEKFSKIMYQSADSASSMPSAPVESEVSLNEES